MDLKLSWQATHPKQSCYHCTRGHSLSGILVLKHIVCIAEWNWWWQLSSRRQCGALWLLKRQLKRRSHQFSPSFISHYYMLKGYLSTLGQVYYFLLWSVGSFYIFQKLPNTALGCLSTFRLGFQLIHSDKKKNQYLQFLALFRAKSGYKGKWLILK